MNKRIDIDIRLRSSGSEKQARFCGFAYVESGFLAGNIESSGTALRREELILLTAFTLTGCPIAARRCGNAFNPWSLTNGAYIGHRMLTSQHFSAESFLEARATSEGVAMDLQVRYDGSLPRVTSIPRPFQEVITQKSRGILEGKFEAIFEDDECGLHKTTTTTKYELALGCDIQTAWRNITILASAEAGQLRQIEQIDLFASYEDAMLDVRQKGQTLDALPVKRP